MENYSKVVSEKEFLFTLLASREEICPLVISWKRQLNKYVIELEKYPSTLIKESNWDIYKDSAVALVEKLHLLGIFHSDITEENFVVNPETKVIKLIDFGLSCWIDEITEEQLTNTYMTKANSVSELLTVEVKEVEWLCEQS